jgi:hypothetical protein
MIDKQRFTILAVLGAGVLLTLAVVGSQTQDSDDSTASKTATASSDDVGGRQDGDRAWWGIPARHVDPATRLEFDDREPKHWESLGSDGRIAQTEQQLESLAEQISASNDPEVQAQLRDRALTVLSWARADYFGDMGDPARYEAHELAFESP